MSCLSNPCEILVVGAGAVGGYFSSHLANQDNVRVSLVCRSDYDAVKSRGYEIISPKGNYTYQPDGIYRSATEYDRKADFILVCSKVLPEADVAEMIRPAVNSKTAIVLIQNGINIEAPVAEAFPDNELISGIAYIGVTRIAPGKISHTDGGTLKFGNYPKGLSEKTQLLCDMFNSNNIPASAHEDIQRIRWEKLTWNAPFNPVSVLTMADTRQLVNTPETCQLAKDIMAEVCAVAAAAGWEQKSDIIERQIEFTRQFRPYKPSMLADFEAGRPMETEAIMGNLVREAEKLSVPVPCSKSVYAMLKLRAKT